MITPFPVSLEIAAVIGGIGFLMKSLKPARSIPDLVSKVDTNLANRLNLCHKMYTRDAMSQGKAVWEAIGGLRGFPHFLAQVRLLVSIVFELRKSFPGLFESETDHVRGAILAVVIGFVGATVEAIRCHYYPGMDRMITFVCGEIYVQLRSEVVVSLEIYQQMLADSIS